MNEADIPDPGRPRQAQEERRQGKSVAGRAREILTGHGRTVLNQRLVALRRELAAASADSRQSSSEPDAPLLGDGDRLQRLIALTVEVNQLEGLLELADDPELELGAAIGPGTVVEVVDAASGRRQQYELVGGERDSDSSVVQLDSPLGQALLGRRPGSLVTLNLADGMRRVQIVSTTPAATGAAAEDLVAAGGPLADDLRAQPEAEPVVTSR